jgi:hypothetical protein
MVLRDQETLESIRTLALSILRENLNAEEKISISDLGDHCLITFSVKVPKLGSLKRLSFDEIDLDSAK